MRLAFIQPVFPLYSSFATRACLLASVALLAACANKTTIDERDSFTHGNTYSHSFTGSSEAACEAGRRALLGQGYIIDKAEPNQISGHKNYQDSQNDNQHGQILFNVTCAPSGSHQAVVYANAVRDLYTMKRSSNSASVGLSVLGSVSMPLGASDDSLVKTSSETISRGAFYEGFFQQVEQNMLPAQTAIDARRATTQKPQTNGAANTKPQAGQAGKQPVPPSTSQPGQAAPPSPAQPAPSTTPPTQSVTPPTTQPSSTPSTQPAPTPSEQSGTATPTGTTPATSTESSQTKQPASSSQPAAPSSTTPASSTTSDSESGDSNTAPAP